MLELAFCFSMLSLIRLRKMILTPIKSYRLEALCTSIFSSNLSLFSMILNMIGAHLAAFLRSRRIFRLESNFIFVFKNGNLLIVRDAAVSRNFLEERAR